MAGYNELKGGELWYVVVNSGSGDVIYICTSEFLHCTLLWAQGEVFTPNDFQ